MTRRSAARGRAPLVDLLALAADDPAYPFHMPGHRSGPGAPPLGLELFGERLYRLDRSEMGGLPYLHAPDRDIAEAQQLAADCFGAAATWFLVNGSTVGNQAALLSATDADSVVLAPRASHRSVHAGLVLSGAAVAWIPSEFDEELGGRFAPDLAAARQIAGERHRVDMIHLTRPSYYGVAPELGPWRDLADDLDAMLVVDEAHGSHLVLEVAGAPRSALAAGADVVIQSTHKTLGGLTQASMVHVGRAADSEASTRVDTPRLADALSLLQSSSPSYLLLASLDAARAQVDAEGAALARELQRLVERVRSEVGPIDDVRQWPQRPDLDPSKIVIDVTATGCRGYEFAERLRANGAGVELADLERVVLSLAVADSDVSVTALVEALAATVRGSTDSSERVWLSDLPPPPPMPASRMTPRAAALASWEACDRDACAGRIAAEFVLAYPPGIPLVVPGEEISAEILSFIDATVARGGSIFGPADPTVSKLQVVAGP